MFRAARAFEREVGWAVAPAFRGAEVRGGGAGCRTRPSSGPALLLACWRWPAWAARLAAAVARCHRSRPAARAHRCGCRSRTASWPPSPRSRASSSRPCPARGEGLAAFARRLCGDARARLPRSSRPTAARQGAAAPACATGRPSMLLSPEWQLKACTALFAEDRGEADGWRHKVRGVGPLQRESLWHLAQWFTGSGRELPRHPRVQRADGRRRAARHGGDHPLRAAAAGLHAPSLPVPERALPARLRQGQGRRVRHLPPAARARRSTPRVVVRFTGRVFAADVNALAAEIAKRSGISGRHRHPHRLPGQDPVRRPAARSSCPRGTPGARSTRRACAPSARFSNQVKATGLAGITVDARRRPRRPGRRARPCGGVWESLYVYDIALRVKRLLETRTAARVLVTTRDGDDFRIHGRRRPALLARPRGADHAALSDRGPQGGGQPALVPRQQRLPPGRPGATRIPEKVVFLSIHADSLHPSLRGADGLHPGGRHARTAASARAARSIPRARRSRRARG